MRLRLLCKLMTEKMDPSTSRTPVPCMAGAPLLCALGSCQVTAPTAAPLPQPAPLAWPQIHSPSSPPAASALLPQRSCLQTLFQGPPSRQLSEQSCPAPAAPQGKLGGCWRAVAATGPVGLPPPIPLYVPPYGLPCCWQTGPPLDPGPHRPSSQLPGVRPQPAQAIRTRPEQPEGSSMPCVLR